jgi:hypothetical protein
MEPAMTKKNKSRADSEISNSAASLPLIFSAAGIRPLNAFVEMFRKYLDIRPAAGRNRRGAWLRVHGK